MYLWYDCKKNILQKCLKGIWGDYPCLIVAGKSFIMKINGVGVVFIIIWKIAINIKINHNLSFIPRVGKFAW